MTSIKYVPLLRWKRGEQVALASLSEAARERVTPLIILANDQFRLFDPE